MAQRTSEHTSGRGSLYGMVVVIDPGHGGRDPGSRGWFWNGTRRVVEDEYCYDVALRLRDEVRRRGGIALMTLRDTRQTKPNESGPWNVIPFDANEFFVSNGLRAHAGDQGMIARLRVAHDASRRYPAHRIVFVSIHFDATGDPQVQGAHFVVPQRYVPEFAVSLEQEFRAAHRLRSRSGEEYHPVVRNGDRRHGMRMLFILRGQGEKRANTWNPIRQRILIELGNFKSSQDVWRIRNPDVRRDYARIITRALEETNTLLISRTRTSPH